MGNHVGEKQNARLPSVQSNVLGGREVGLVTPYRSFPSIQTAFTLPISSFSCLMKDASMIPPPQPPHFKHLSLPPPPPAPNHHLCRP